MQAIIDYLKELSPAGLLLHIAIVIFIGLSIFVFIPNSWLKGEQSSSPKNKESNKTKNLKADKQPALKSTKEKRKLFSFKSESKAQTFEKEHTKKGGFFSRKDPQLDSLKNKEVIIPEYKNDGKNPRANKFIFKRAQNDPTYFKHPPVTDYFAKLVKPEPTTNLKSQDLDELDGLFTTMISEGAISSKKFLVTSFEHQYLEKLRIWFGYKYYIYCQVSVGSAMKIDAEVSNLAIQQRRKFAQKCHNMSYDFMLIDKETDRIVCAIELDDPTHQRYDRIARDRRLDKVSQAAEIPLFHITNINQKPDLSRLA